MVSKKNTLPFKGHESVTGDILDLSIRNKQGREEDLTSVDINYKVPDSAISLNRKTRPLFSKGDKNKMIYQV